MLYSIGMAFQSELLISVGARGFPLVDLGSRSDPCS
jgi:hypothetical protein